MEWSEHKPLIVRPSQRQMVCRASTDAALAALRAAGESGGTWAGYLSYDLGRAFEVLPARATDDLQTPLVAICPLDAAPIADPGLDASHPSSDQLRSTFTREAYLAAVQRCIDYIAAGDVFQINLSQRFTAPLARPAFEVFQDLQQRFPARYPAYLDFGNHQVISNSPELFLKVERLPDGSRKIINRPIKGTRPVGPGMFEALESSSKDRAELAMIVDLQRNDLGRICRIGSVKVTDPRSIETHPTVLHGVATVEGVLRDDVSLIDILRATFPCGSITGCPKIRAMQIIDELEPVRRGVYCGAIGWFDADGQMEWSVAIRTMTVQDGQIHIPVGGGVVADSSPDAEYEETLIKARAMFAAAGVKPW